MSDKSTTKRASFAFAAKEFSDGQSWIMLEPTEKGSTFVGNGFIGLEFRETVSFDEIQQIAELLNDKVASVSFTDFPK